MNDKANTEEPGVSEVNPNEDPSHPIRNPAGKFSAGQEVTYNGQPAKITSFDESTGNYMISYSTTHEVSEGDLTEI